MNAHPAQSSNRPHQLGVGGTLFAVFALVGGVYALTAGLAINQAWETYADIQHHAQRADIPGPELLHHVLEEARSSLGIQIALMATAALPFMLAISILHSRVLRPIHKLTAVLHQLARGEAGAPIDDTARDDEIGAMARAAEVFRRATLQLKDDALERQRLQEQLRTLWLAVEHSPASILITDPAGKIIYVNPKFIEITGYTRDEVVGQKPGLVSGGRTPTDVYQELWNTISSGQEWRGEFYNRRRNGEYYWEKTWIAPIRGHTGDIQYFVAVKEDITDRKDSEIRIWQQAHYDALTDLPNRVLFDDRLQRAIAHAKRHGGMLALMYVDLDRFKQINDTLGHEAGDELLQETAYRLRRCVRECDTVSRIGGDEFVVLLTDLNRDGEAAEVAKRVVIALAEPFDLDAGAAMIGASVGIAIYPRDGATAAMLAKNADAAMYWCKSDGRNGYRFFSHSPDDHLDGYGM